jgi:DNA helicase-2/ATP-dependent DNA helicase PcrA
MSDELVPSVYQQQLYDFVQHGSGSAVVVAVAGSGKTYSIKECLKFIPPSQSVQLFAFNTEIALVLKNYVKAERLRHVMASTFHSVGYWALCHYFGMKAIETNGRKLQQLCREKLSDFSERRRYEAFICRLVDLAKGVGIGALVPDQESTWEELVAHHDLYLDDPSAKEERAIKYARELLQWSTDAAEQNYSIDFSDQLYLTVKWNLPVDRKDWVFVDEAQDTNPIRRAIIERVLNPNGRLIAVGDPCQAIYGFTGASIDAIDQIKERWGCIELPLSVCYRCPTKVVEQARALVPYIESAPYAPEGAVLDLTQREALMMLTPADVVLCRNNAPLVDLAYQCLSMGIGCQILGRDIGKGLQSLVDKMQGTDVDDLIKRLGIYRTREVARLLERDQHGKAQSVDDRVQCLYTLIDNLPENDRSLAGLAAALDKLFGDNITERLTLSTVHKAKGREWPQVAILKPELMPAPWADTDWEEQQEENVMYVAWTRARAVLIFMHD